MVYTSHVTGFAITRYIDSKHAELVNTFLRSVMKKYCIKSITTDNGGEFLQLHKLITKENRLKIYYCDPGAPHQKGQVEHFNMEMRRYIKKDAVFTKTATRKIQKHTEVINQKSRKRLNYNSPADLEPYLFTCTYLNRITQDVI